MPSGVCVWLFNVSLPTLPSTPSVVMVMPSDLVVLGGIPVTVWYHTHTQENIHQPILLLCVRAHTHMYTHTHTHTKTNTHTHPHAHTHTCTHTLSFPPCVISF